jgi:hypothetical protein
VPDRVLSSNYWLDNTQVSQFKVSGLNHSRRYRIGFIGSSSIVGWFKGNYTATYTINGRTVYLNSWMNSSKIVYIDNVQPDENGEIYLDFSTTEAAAYGFNAGVIIEDYTDPSQVTVVNAGNSVLGSVTAEENKDRSGEDRLREAGSVKLYPNPFTDFVNMEFNNTSDDNNVSIELYDLSGRLNYKREFGRLPKGNNTVRLSAADAGLKTGIYIVTLTVNGKTLEASKVIKVGK